MGTGAGIVANSQALIRQPKNRFKRNHIAWQADGMHLCPVNGGSTCLLWAVCVFQRNFQEVAGDRCQFFREFACGPAGRINFCRTGVFNDLPRGQVAGVSLPVNILLRFNVWCF